MLNRSGDFYVGTVADSPEKHLVVFSQFKGLNNYKDFNNETLPASMYGLITVGIRS
ncbi:MAG: hypothetical protein JXR80_02610 [Deltaproteobacteria bacterium]|nr:hypothetical protein [Deltaproteobacteria bacterium]